MSPAFCFLSNANFRREREEKRGEGGEEKERMCSEYQQEDWLSLPVARQSSELKPAVTVPELPTEA
jgi:hypothetical protein